MYSSRLVHLFVVVISIMALGHAAWLDLGLFGRSVKMVEARQNTGTPTSTPSSSSTSSASPTSSSSRPGGTTSVPPTSSSQTPTPSSSLSVSIPTSTPPPTTSSTPLPSSSQGQSSTTPPPSSTPSSSSDQQGGGVTTVTEYTLIETTDSAGSKSSYTSTAIKTQGLSQNGGGGSQMTDGVRNIIIGVCVGVGGAIILVVAGLLLWRLRSKKRQQDDHDELAGTSQFNHGQDKSDHSGSTTGRSPFQSTLESYHAPTQTNTASNF